MLSLLQSSILLRNLHEPLVQVYISLRLRLRYGGFWPFPTIFRGLGEFGFTGAEPRGGPGWGTRVARRFILGV